MNPSVPPVDALLNLRNALISSDSSKEISSYCVLLTSISVVPTILSMFSELAPNLSTDRILGMSAVFIWWTVVLLSMVDIAFLRCPLRMANVILFSVPCSGSDLGGRGRPAAEDKALPMNAATRDGHDFNAQFQDAVMDDTERTYDTHNTDSLQVASGDVLVKDTQIDETQDEVEHFDDDETQLGKGAIVSDSKTFELAYSISSTSMNLLASCDRSSTLVQDTMIDNSEETHDTHNTDRLQVASGDVLEKDTQIDETQQEVEYFDADETQGVIPDSTTYQMSNSLSSDYTP